jgi:ABC-type nickel/cobalt efflux system permease component RcnA
MRTLLLVLTIVLGATAGLSRAEADPFNGRHEVPVGTGTMSLMPAGVMRSLGHMQMQLNETISDEFRSVRETGSAAAMLAVLALAFLYGVVHAAGPGHGKSVVGSYFVANEARWFSGFLMGGLISLMQGLTAIAIVFVMSLVLHSKQLRVANQGALVDCVSYGVVAAIGLVLFWRAATGRGHVHAPGRPGHVHGAACGRAGHDGAPIAARGNGQRVLIAATGVAPCASAIIIMLFALANDAMGVGVAAVLALSLGMAVTVSAVGMLGIVARRFLMRLSVAAGPRVERAERILRLLGSAAIVGFAGLLMLGALSRF